MSTPNNLNFRLTTPRHGSLTASSSDEVLSAELLAATEQLVAMAFAKMHLPNVPKTDRVPEVIADSTLAQIEALEFCRNLMIDSDAEDDDVVDDWKRAIDQAADALGYSEDDR